MDRAVVDALEGFAAGDGDRLRFALHPYLHWRRADGQRLRGRKNVLAMLDAADALPPPSSYEIRDGQVYRWNE